VSGADVSDQRPEAEAAHARVGSSSPFSVPVTALDLGGDAVFVTDRDGIIVDVNDDFVRVTGYARDEAIGQTPRMLSSGLQDDDFYERLWATITAGDVWEGELIDRRRDGELRTHHVTITPVRDGSGRITHFVAVERDLSGELARASGSKPSGLVHTDRAGRCIYADREAAGMLARDAADLLGDGLRSALTDEDVDALVEAVEMAVDRGRDYRVDLRTLEGRWLRCEVAPLTLASGAAIGTRCSLEDITERIEVEHELARRSALVNSVLDALEEPIAVIGADGVVLLANRAWQERSGADPGLLGQLRVGADARGTVAAAAAAGDELAVALREDLENVLTGRARGRRHHEGFTVHPLGWDEGGAVLRHRGPAARADGAAESLMPLT
jgi:PAS domain S-box-containing protein